jgi:sugar phosphate isomerase/epimerase
LTDNIAKCARHLLAVHVSDNDGVDERHWLPYEGVIDWAMTMQAMRAVGFKGAFVFEAVPRLVQLHLKCRGGKPQTEADIRFTYLRVLQDHESLLRLARDPIAAL